MKHLILALLCSQSLSCLAGSGDGDVQFIPSFSMECAGLVYPGRCDATADGSTAYLGFIKDTSIDCESYLSGQLLVNFQLLFSFSSQTVTTNNSNNFLVGNFSSWRDRDGFAIATADDTQYRVCGIIDVNGNGVIEANDMIADVRKTLGLVGFDLIINDWRQKLALELPDGR